MKWIRFHNKQIQKRCSEIFSFWCFFRLKSVGSQIRNEGKGGEVTVFGVLYIAIVYDAVCRKCSENVYA